MTNEYTLPEVTVEGAEESPSPPRRFQAIDPGPQFTYKLKYTFEFGDRLTLLEPFRAALRKLLNSPEFAGKVKILAMQTDAKRKKSS